MPQTIDAKMFYSMFISGVRSLEERKEYINDLNVFPVPDGDTGTNMVLTLNAALRAIEIDGCGADVYELSRIAAMSASRGARGNSGSILSQLMAGFSKGIDGCAQIGKKEIAAGAACADIQARGAVSNPKEGTILTVAGDIAKKADELFRTDITLEAFLKEIIVQAKLTLSRTPDMLPVLKEAGVVDSGGAGLVEFLKGAYRAFSGQEQEEGFKVFPLHKAASAAHAYVDSSDIETSDIKYTYCTEFIVNTGKELGSENRNQFKKYLEELGDSLVFVCTDEFVKVHVHTNHPGLVFEKGLEYGTLTGIKVDNMKEEHSEKLELERSLEHSKQRFGEADAASAAAFEDDSVSAAVPLKEYAFVSVCAGEGIKELFASMSAENIVEGGQTMNPSVEDIIRAVRGAHAENVFVLPNNSNVILTANQAAQFCPDIQVWVIPTRNIAEGISAVINYQPALTAKENAAHMEEALSLLKTVQITWAVRDCEMDGFSILKGQYMALFESRVIFAAQDPEKCAQGALKEFENECGSDISVVSIYYGEGADEESAAKTARLAQEIWEDADVDVVCTGQPVYAFVISLEE